MNQSKFSITVNLNPDNPKVGISIGVTMPPKTEGEIFLEKLVQLTIGSDLENTINEALQPFFGLPITAELESEIKNVLEELLNAAEK